MDGIASARRLSDPPGPRPRFHRRERRAGDGYRVGIAGPQDDVEIRRLLRETVFPGDVRVSLEREPDALAAGSIEGDVHHTLVARDRLTGRVAAIAGRSVRDAFVNGSVVRLGYFGQLRIDRAFRDRRLLDAGFACCRRLHEGAGARLYLASVVADNQPARRLLRRRHDGWPCFLEVAGFVTVALTVGRAMGHVPPGIRIVNGSVVGLEALANCLRRNNRRYQFAPCWSAADLRSPLRSRGLAAGDFVAALRGDGVVGCLACWDQRAFKQVVVRGYSPRLARLRPLVNAASPWTGMPRLPENGTRLDSAYLSHVAVDEDDPDVLQALMTAGCLLAADRGIATALAGFPDGSPLLRRARRSFPHRSYDSVLYVAFWEDGEGDARALDGRPANPELAIL
ncbi:MAG TPA: hypothetical protein VLD67_02975 [Vicinamibacterales bacterium]|nr:hypothetical protein [Vicinamibacterales bacterium]